MIDRFSGLQLLFVFGLFGFVALFSDVSKPWMSIWLFLGISLSPLFLTLFGGGMASESETTRWRRVGLVLEGGGAVLFLLFFAVSVAACGAGLRPNGWKLFLGLMGLGALASGLSLRATKQIWSKLSRIEEVELQLQAKLDGDSKESVGIGNDRYVEDLLEESFRLSLELLEEERSPGAFSKSTWIRWVGWDILLLSVFTLLLFGLSIFLWIVRGFSVMVVTSLAMWGGALLLLGGTIQSRWRMAQQAKKNRTSFSASELAQQKTTGAFWKSLVLLLIGAGLIWVTNAHVSWGKKSFWLGNLMGVVYLLGAFIYATRSGWLPWGRQRFLLVREGLLLHSSRWTLVIPWNVVVTAYVTEVSNNTVVAVELGEDCMEEVRWLRSKAPKEEALRKWYAGVEQARRWNGAALLIWFFHVGVSLDVFWGMLEQGLELGERSNFPTLEEMLVRLSL